MGVEIGLFETLATSSKVLIPAKLIFGHINNRSSYPSPFVHCYKNQVSQDLQFGILVIDQFKHLKL